MSKKIFFLFLALHLILWQVPQPHYAQDVPSTINMQARLVSSQTGINLEGTKLLTLSLYDQETGGNLLWQEQQSATVRAGQVQLALGRVIPLPAAAFSSPNRFLAIKVDAEPEMAPRVPLRSAPYAIKASKASRLEPGSIAEGNLEIKGNAAIGTIPSASKLHIVGPNSNLLLQKEKIGDANYIRFKDHLGQDTGFLAYESVNNDFYIENLPAAPIIFVSMAALRGCVLRPMALSVLGATLIPDCMCFHLTQPRL